MALSLRRGTSRARARSTARRGEAARTLAVTVITAARYLATVVKAEASIFGMVRPKIIDRLETENVRVQNGEAVRADVRAFVKALREEEPNSFEADSSQFSAEAYQKLGEAFGETSLAEALRKRSIR